MLFYCRRFLEDSGKPVPDPRVKTENKKSRSRINLESLQKHTREIAGRIKHTLNYRTILNNLELQSFSQYDLIVQYNQVDVII